MDVDQNSTADLEDLFMSKLERTMKRQVNNPELADCVFLVGEQRTRIYAHKCLLAMNNPVFKSMFFGDLKETREIEVPDLNERGFLNLLSYLYTNQIPSDCKLSDLYWSLTAGNKYLAFDFIRDFLEVISDHLDCFNACQTYDQLLKLQLDDESLVKLVEKVIKRASKLIKINGLVHENDTEIDRHTLESILRFDQLYHDEFYVLRGCLNWIYAELMRKDLSDTVENQRSLFADFKHLIRFSDLDPGDLACLNIHEYLESDEAISVLLHSADKSKPLVIEYRSPRVSSKRLTAEIVGTTHAGRILPSKSVFEIECKFKVDKRVFLSQIETQPILIDVRSIVCEIFREHKRLGEWECDYVDFEARNTITVRFDTYDEIALELEPDIEYKLCFRSTEPLEEPGRLFYGRESFASTKGYGFAFIGPHHCIAKIRFFLTAPLPMCDVQSDD